MPNRTRCPGCGRPTEREITAELLQTMPLAVKLTDSECRTLVLVVAGLTNKQAAIELNTSEQVVKNRMKDVYNKIGVDNRAGLVGRLMRFLYEGK